MLIAALLLGGCYAPFAPPAPAPPGREADQNKVLEIVWHEIYDMPWRAGDTTETYQGPAIYWHYGDTCGGSSGFPSPDGAGYGPDNCAGAEYHDGGVQEWQTGPFEHSNAIDIEWPADATFSSSCIAHEMGHAFEWYQTEDLDPHHTNVAVFAGSSFCSGIDGSAVQHANQLLRGFGL